MDRILLDALEAIHGDRRQWVSLATVNKNGEPNNASMFMDFDADHCYFSMTGHQKKENLRRDPRGCVAITRPFRQSTFVIVWGTMEFRHDSDAQEFWRNMVTQWMGPSGRTVPRDRPLSWEQTSLGVFTPYRWRIRLEEDKPSFSGRA